MTSFTDGVGLVFLGILGLLAAFVMFAVVLGLPIMWLWNGLMPDLFGLTTITFWQAVGLNLLCSFLFKGNSTSTSSSK